MRRFLFLASLLLAAPCFAQSRAKPLIVHEWGTFTALQDENGRSIGYLNSSVEPLPAFVHRLRSGLLYNEPVNVFTKSVGAAHPEVTMRLETPVIYFHPEKNAEPFNVDVAATFKGGVLSEYYPDAKFHIAGGVPAPAGLDRFTNDLAGGLTWKSLRVGGDVKLPDTKEHVWLAPRQVDSAPVAMGTEAERYVFYRGVGNVEAPLQVFRKGKGIEIHQRAGGEQKWGALWLAEFRAGGTCAFRTITNPPAAAEAKAAAQDATFKSEEFSKDHAADLRKEMRAALISDGLFDDEAEAMLNTWERSYFQGVGQRLFFLVPRAWTDRVLPLTISTPNELTRVMIGRIELVTPQQHEAIAQLPANPKAMDLLGRFGYALVLDELRQRPSAGLAKFAKDQGINERTPTTKPAPTAVGLSEVTPLLATPNSGRGSR